MSPWSLKKYCHSSMSRNFKHFQCPKLNFQKCSLYKQPGSFPLVSLSVVTFSKQQHIVWNTCYLFLCKMLVRSLWDSSGVKNTCCPGWWPELPGLTWWHDGRRTNFHKLFSQLPHMYIYTQQINAVKLFLKKFYHLTWTSIQECCTLESRHSK